MAGEISAEFRDLAQHYPGPNEAVARELRRKAIVPVVGPTAVGKSTLMDIACKLDNRFGRVQSFTTRKQRSNEPDDAYRFLPHADETIAELERKVRARELVQVAIHPTTNRIYGSELVDYSAPYNLLDTLSGAVDAMRNLPFGHSVTVAVATEPKNWREWFMKRAAASNDKADALSRLHEADESIRWCLHDLDVMWVHNQADFIEHSAKMLVDMACGDAESDSEGRRWAVKMQNDIPNMMKMVEGLAA